MTAPHTDGILVIDADTHYTEPWDLWTSRAPAHYRDRVPHVEEIAGEPQWVFDGATVGPARAVCVVDADQQKHLGSEYLFRSLVHEVSPAASQVGPRLALMDELGVWAHLVYPNAIGFSGKQLGATGDVVLRDLVLEMYNDAMAEMQADSNGRLFPMAVLPWWDLRATLDEIERIKGMGMVGVNMLSDPQDHGLPDLSDPHWTPMFEALEDADLPLNFHIGGSASQLNYFGTAAWPSRSNDEKLALGTAMLCLANARIVANFILSGLLERHPRLHMVSVESGVGWIPFLLETLLYQLLETAPETAKKLSLTPREYFQRQISACFWFESDQVVANIKYIGEDNCLFETDFPHPTCLYPDPVSRAMQAFVGETDDFKRKVFGGNAARIYHLPMPATVVAGM